MKENRNLNSSYWLFFPQFYANRLSHIHFKHRGFLLNNSQERGFVVKSPAGRLGPSVKIEETKKDEGREQIVWAAHILF